MRFAHTHPSETTIMTCFVHDGRYELANYMKKHEIVNKIESILTRAFIKVSKRED